MAHCLYSRLRRIYNLTSLNEENALSDSSQTFFPIGICFFWVCWMPPCGSKRLDDLNIGLNCPPFCHYQRPKCLFAACGGHCFVRILVENPPRFHKRQFKADNLNSRRFALARLDWFNYVRNERVYKCGGNGGRRDTPVKCSGYCSQDTWYYV